MITKPLLQAVRNDLDAALATLGAKHGLQIKSGRCVFSTGYFEIKVIANEPGESKEASAWRSSAAYLGLQPDMLGKEVKYAGRTFVVTGITSTGAKVTVTGDGKPYLIRVADFIRGAKLAA